MDGKPQEPIELLRAEFKRAVEHMNCVDTQQYIKLVVHNIKKEGAFN